MTNPQPTPQEIILGYVKQPNPVTCQSATIAKMIGDPDVYKIREALEQMGDPGDPAVMSRYLESRVKEYRYTPKGSLNSLIIALKDGWKVITHGWFTDQGHVISIVDWDFKTQTFGVDDPFFEFNFPGWTYAPHEATGDNVRYSARGIWASCVHGQGSGDAESAYHSNPKIGQKEFCESEMWLHLIKN